MSTTPAPVEISVDEFLQMGLSRVILLTWNRECDCNRCVYCQDEAECPITLNGASDLWFPIAASDGRIYDARALQHWLQCCRLKERTLEVIPTRIITHVTPLSLTPKLRRAQRRARDALSCVRSVAFKLRRVARNTMRAQTCDQCIQTDPTNNTILAYHAFPHRPPVPNPPSLCPPGLPPRVSHRRRGMSCALPRRMVANAAVYDDACNGAAKCALW